MTGLRRTGFKKLSFEEVERRRDVRKKKRRKRANKPNQIGRWKKRVRDKDGFTCQYPGCGVIDLHIHAHHVAPRSQRPDLKHVVSNGACLCFTHHEWVHKHPIQARELGLLSEETYERAAKEGRLGLEFEDQEQEGAADLQDEDEGMWAGDCGCAGGVHHRGAEAEGMDENQS